MLRQNQEQVNITVKVSHYCFPQDTSDLILDNVPAETYLSVPPETFEIITFSLPFFYQEAEDAINLFLFHRA